MTRHGGLAWLSDAHRRSARERSGVEVRYGVFNIKRNNPPVRTSESRCGTGRPSKFIAKFHAPPAHGKNRGRGLKDERFDSFVQCFKAERDLFINGSDSVSRGEHNRFSLATTMCFMLRTSDLETKSKPLPVSMSHLEIRASRTGFLTIGRAVAILTDIRATHRWIR